MEPIQRAQGFLLPALVLLFQHFLARQDDFVFLPVDLDDLELDLLPKKRLEIGNIAQVDERAGHEPFDPLAQVNDHARVDHLLYPSLFGSPFFKQPVQLLPSLFPGQALVRDHNLALLLIHIDNRDLYLLSRGKAVAELFPLLQIYFSGRQQGFALVADIQVYLVRLRSNHLPVTCSPT